MIHFKGYKIEWLSIVHWEDSLQLKNLIFLAFQNLQIPNQVITLYVPKASDRYVATLVML